jgi:hypothetical protein
MKPFFWRAIISVFLIFFQSEELALIILNLWILFGRFKKMS